MQGLGLAWRPPPRLLPSVAPTSPPTPRSASSRHHRPFIISFVPPDFSLQFMRFCPPSPECSHVQPPKPFLPPASRPSASPPSNADPRASLQRSQRQKHTPILLPSPTWCDESAASHSARLPLAMWLLPSLPPVHHHPKPLCIRVNLLLTVPTQSVGPGSASSYREFRA